MKYTIQEYDIPSPEQLKDGAHVHYSLDIPGVPIFLPIVERDGVPHLFAIVNTNDADTKYRFICVPTGGVIDSGFSYNPLGSWLYEGLKEFYHLFEIKEDSKLITDLSSKEARG